MLRKDFKGVILFSAILFLFPPVGYVYAQKLIVSYAGTGGAYFPLAVAGEAGLFKKYGLEVDLIFVVGSLGLNTLVSGRTPIIAVSPLIIVLGAARASDAVMIATMTNTLPYLLVARPEIKTKEDLRGKRVAISRFGSATDLVMQMALQQGLGLVPMKDVTILQLGDAPTRLAALESNVVQASVFTPPTHLVAKKKGFSILVDIASLRLRIPNSTLATTRFYLNSNRENVRKFLMAYIEGIKLMKSDPEFSIKILSRQSRVTDRESLEEAYRIYGEAVPEKPYLDVSSVQKVIDFVSKSNPEAGKVKVEDVMDMGLLQEIDRSGFIDSLYKR